MTNQHAMKTLVRETVIIIAAAVLTGFCINLVHPRGYEPISKEQRSLRKVVFISAEEARLKLDSEKGVFIDTRSAQEYAAGHIPGALNIPAHPESISMSKVRDHFKKLGGPVELVLYCDGDNCSSSEVLARRLFGMGYQRHLYIITGGYPEWIGSDYPVDEGVVKGKDK